MDLLCVLMLALGWLLFGVIGVLYFCAYERWKDEKARYDYTINELIRIYVGVDLGAEGKRFLRDGGDDRESDDGIGDDSKRRFFRKKRRLSSVDYMDRLNVSIKEKVDEAIRGYEIPKE